MAWFDRCHRQVPKASMFTGCRRRARDSGPVPCPGRAAPACPPGASAKNGQAMAAQASKPVLTSAQPAPEDPRGTPSGGGASPGQCPAKGAAPTAPPQRTTAAAGHRHPDYPVPAVPRPAHCRLPGENRQRGTGPGLGHVLGTAACASPLPGKMGCARHDRPQPGVRRSAVIQPAAAAS